MLRLRLRRVSWPRRALVLADTPRPDCHECGGEGGFEHHYGDYETGEYAGTDWEPCTCWNEDRKWLLLPLPRRCRSYPDPWGTNGYSDEPPF